MMPASMLYGFLARSKNFAFDHGASRPRKLGVPVVSIGNLTVGGTGKTPLAIQIARLLIAAGERPVVLSRGYLSQGRGTRIVSDGRTLFLGPELAGDEPFLMALRVAGLGVVVDPDRVRGGQAAVRDLKPSIILLDDGFQHRRLARDLDILVLDAVDPFGRYRLLPSGRLREPVSGIARADVVIVTRAPGKEPLATLEAVVRRYNDRAPILRARHVSDAIVPAADLAPGPFPSLLAPQRGPEPAPERPVQTLAGRSVFAFCGLGNPEAFRATLGEAGARLVGFRAFRDHHAYASSEIAALRSDAAAAGAATILTTEKDAVRLPDPGSREGIDVLRIRMEIDDAHVLEARMRALGKAA